MNEQPSDSEKVHEAQLSRRESPLTQTTDT